MRTGCHMTRMPVTTLKRRAEFLRIRGGKRWACAAFVLEAKTRAHLERDQNQGPAKPRITGPRIGYTVTKRIGNAVVRNRVKRRLRAAVAALEPGDLRDNCDYVLIARPGALQRPFIDLTNDLRAGLQSVHRQKQRKQASIKH
ncbi:MAG: ribonuclease P protein component [Hyphomicrobiaceae bacterium]